MCKAGNKLSTYTSNSCGSFFVVCFVLYSSGQLSTLPLCSHLSCEILREFSLHHSSILKRVAKVQKNISNVHVQCKKTQEQLQLLKPKISPSQCCVFKISIAYPSSPVQSHVLKKAYIVILRKGFRSSCSWTLDMAYMSLNQFIFKLLFKEFYKLTLYCAEKAVPFPSS